MVRRFEEISFTPVGDTPEAFGAFVKAEIEKWGKIVRELGLSADSRAKLFSNQSKTSRSTGAGHGIFHLVIIMLIYSIQKEIAS